MKKNTYIQEKDGYKIAYRPKTSDEQAIKKLSLTSSKLIDPFYQIERDDTIIMVGGYIGFVTIYTSSKASKGKVYSIEPNKENFELLKINIEQNNIKNVILDNYAISDFNGDIKLYLDDNLVGHSITDSHLNKYEIVKSISLNNYFEKRNIKKCDLIAMNCEGAEFDVIKNTTSDCFDKIKNMIISYHLDKAKNQSINIITDKLKDNNYKVFILRRRKNRGLIIAYKRPCGNRVKFYYKNYIFYVKNKIFRKIKKVLFK